MATVKYLQKFPPHLADVTTLIRELMKTEVEFRWDETVHGKCFQQIKSLMTQTPVLKYFDAKEQITLQGNASQFIIGACLLKNGQPIAYASRTLMVPETT